MVTQDKPRITINAKPWSAAQKRAFAALDARAQELGPKLKKSDFDRDGNPKPGPWADLMAEFDAWAAKYKAELRTSEHLRESLGSPTGGTAVPLTSTNCPSRTTSTEHFDFPGGYRITMNHTCYLRRETLLGRCVYKCSYELESGYVTR